MKPSTFIFSGLPLESSFRVCRLQRENSKPTTSPRLQQCSGVFWCILVGSVREGCAPFPLRFALKGLVKLPARHIVMSVLLA